MARQLSPDYYAYMRSAAWRARRRAYFASPRTPKKCQGCDRHGPLDLHHRTYVRFTQERQSDLVPVCRPCHQAIHRDFDSRTGNLPAHTRKVLEELRRHHRLPALASNGRPKTPTRGKAMTKAQARAALNSPRSVQLHPAVRAALERRVQNGRSRSGEHSDR